MVARRPSVVARPGRLLATTLTLVVLAGCTSGGEPQPGPTAAHEADRSRTSAPPDPTPSPTSPAADGTGDGAQEPSPVTGPADSPDEYVPDPEELRRVLVETYTPLMVLQPQGFSASHRFQARDGWTVLSSNGRCALSSRTLAAPTDGPTDDVPGAARDASFAALRDVLAAEQGAKNVSAESESLVFGEERTEPRKGTNVATQDWTVERAGSPVRSRVLARARTFTSYSGVTMRASTVLSFECTGTTIDEKAWTGVLEWLRLPATAVEAAGVWPGA
ncbi:MULTISPECIES: hypothetical protein [Oerskovia]|uniref:PknH-like extracellular domain-containing protein n=1 Tax=Oerskovia rustica TaxID=2762237 RepID=A0ABR8RTL1_9CELL|nr:hypothetical protein [Oerskovia rustica]MBD7951074.1 hypothetical protein [Oerskovia rustica]